MIARAALMVAALMTTATASAQQGCTGLAALTGTDGRSLNDIELRIDRDQPGVLIEARGRILPLPPAEECELSVDADRNVGLHCEWQSTVSWQPGFADAETHFDALVAQFNGCRTDPLPPSAPPGPYGGSNSDYVALRSIESQFEQRSGLTKFSMRLIDAPNYGSGRRRYIRLNVEFEPSRPEWRGGDVTIIEPSDEIDSPEE